MTRRLACALLVLWSASVLAQEAPRPDFALPLGRGQADPGIPGTGEAGKSP
jgi:hypothetical protein